MPKTPSRLRSFALRLRPRVLADARYPWAYLLKVVRNESLNIVRRRKPMRRLKVRTKSWCEYIAEPGEAGIAHLRPAGAEQTPADPGGSRRPENLGRNDVRGNRRGAGAVAEYGGQPLSLRPCKNFRSTCTRWRRCIMTDLRQLREIEKLVEDSVFLPSPRHQLKQRVLKRAIEAKYRQTVVEAIWHHNVGRIRNFGNYLCGFSAVRLGTISNADSELDRKRTRSASVSTHPTTTSNRRTCSKLSRIPASRWARNCIFILPISKALTRRKPSSRRPSRVNQICLTIKTFRRILNKRVIWLSPLLRFRP